MNKEKALKCLIGVLFTLGAALGYADDIPEVTHSKVLPTPHKVTDPDQYRMSVGFLGGINVPEGSYKSTPEIGMDFGFQPYVPYGAAVELTTSAFGQTRHKLQKRTTFLFKGTYNFGGDTPVIKYSYVGMGVGPTFLNSGTEMAIAPLMGFDIPLQGETGHQEWSLGFYAKYLIVTTDDPNSLVMMGSLKYWF